jgi:signal transduction histidine kinase
MDIKVIILISVAFLNLALGGSVLFHNSRSVVSRWFALFAFGLAAWSFGMMMYGTGPEDWQTVYWWSLILHFAGAFIAFTFLHFSLVYPEEKMPVSLWWHVVFFIPVIFIFYFLFIDKQIIVDLKFFSNNRQLIYGPWYSFYFVYFFMYMGGASFTLLRKSFIVEGIEKKQIRSVFWGTLVPLICAGVINMFMAAWGDFKYAWTGPVFLLMVVIFIAYAIIKLKFLDVKVITTEIFAIFLALVAFEEIFMARSFEELIVRMIIFAITLIFAILLIRSVLNEVRRREEMEKLTEELKLTTKKLAKANKELERLDEAKSEFLSIASHQLRTPSTIIKGYISMMLEGSFGKAPKLIKDNLNKIYLSNERLLNLIETLLNISRIESGRIEFNVQPINLVAVIEPIVSDFQKKAKERGLKLEFLPEKNVPEALADREKTKEVISNLIDNSLKYTKQGEVTVGLHQESRSVVFTCQDTGIGIDSEDVPRLFNKFVRGKGMMQVYTEGTGLGLYFARMVIENMGGRIWAESPGKEKGSKFSFSLPLADKEKAKKVGTMN